VATLRSVQNDPVGELLHGPKDAALSGPAHSLGDGEPVGTGHLSRRTVKAGALLALTVVIGGGVWLALEDGEPPLRGTSSASGAMPAEGAGTYTAVFVGDLCLAKDADSVQVLDVQPYQPTGDLKITDFSVYTHPEPGENPGAVENSRLRDVPTYAAGSDVVRVPCTADSSYFGQGVAVEAYMSRVRLSGREVSC
jgi:hypothetical protein